MWAGILSVFIGFGLFISLRYPDLQFPVGNLFAIAGIMSLLTGLPGMP